MRSRAAKRWAPRIQLFGSPDGLMAGLPAEVDNLIGVVPPPHSLAAGSAEDATPVAHAVAVEWLRTFRRCPDGVSQTYSAQLPPWVASRAPAGKASRARGPMHNGKPWTLDEAADWLHAAAYNLRFAYKLKGKITIDIKIDSPAIRVNGLPCNFSFSCGAQRWIAPSGLLN